MKRSESISLHMDQRKLDEPTLNGVTDEIQNITRLRRILRETRPNDNFVLDNLVNNSGGFTAAEKKELIPLVLDYLANKLEKHELTLNTLIYGEHSQNRESENQNQDGNEPQNHDGIPQGDARTHSEELHSRTDNLDPGSDSEHVPLSPQESPVGSTDGTAPASAL